MGVSGQCPSCGAPVEFTAARSVVVVCDSCETVVGRAGDALQNYGKVAELVRTESPLEIGVSGEYRGRKFEVLGRVQLRHEAGGIWDEWYASIGGDSWFWIAESQGKVHVTSARRLKPVELVPTIESLQVDTSVTLPSLGVYRVAEVGLATVGFAEGELPRPIRPGTQYAFADLEGGSGRFATLDAGCEPGVVFAGQQVSYMALGLAEAAAREDVVPEQATVAVTCSNCGGSLELRAPDETQRVVCPYCDSLHDVNQGNLKFLQVLGQSGPEPILKIGTRGTLRGREYTVIGHLRREVIYEGTSYPWEEYLLYTPRQPFHWLIHAQGHWSLGQPVSAGDVVAYSRTASYRERSFRLFDKGRPCVTEVHGEFPWRVQIGETVDSADYVSPPWMLSREVTTSVMGEFAAANEASDVVDATVVSDGSGASAGQSGGWGAEALEEQQRRLSSSRVPPARKKKGRPPLAQEVNYTLNEYLSHAELKAAFGIKRLGIPLTVAPHQPYPGRAYVPVAGIAFAVVCFAFLAMLLLIRPNEVMQFPVVEQLGGTNEYWSPPFELRALRNVRVSATTAGANWGYFEGYLIRDGDAEGRTFALAIESGSSRSKYLMAFPEGTYRLRVRPQFPAGSAGTRTINVTLAQGAVNPTNWMVLLGMTGVPLALLLIGYFLFEQSRWSQSDYSPWQSQSDSGSSGPSGLSGIGAFLGVDGDSDD